MNQIEAMLEALFDELSDGICASDAEGRLFYLNSTAERLLEISRADAAGRSLCDLLCGHLAAPGSEECASSCPLRDFGTGQKAVTFSGRYNERTSYEWRDLQLKRVQKWKNLRVRCFRMPSWPGRGAKDGHLTTIQDASAELEFERQKEEWRSMIAHDLRAPLTTIYAALRTIQDETEPVPQKLNSELIGRSVRACQNMMKLLELYLEVAKIDAGLMPVRLARLNLLELARKCAEEQGALAKEKLIEVSLDVEPTIHVHADPDLLSRVIQNLLDNAIKFTPEGGKIAITGKLAGDGMATLAVRDTGPGIDAQDFPYIFDRYYQAKARREGRIKGNGLGLAFCQEAMKAMKGDVVVKSTLGQGSTFTMRLPTS